MECGTCEEIVKRLTGAARPWVAMARVTTPVRSEENCMMSSDWKTILIKVCVKLEVRLSMEVKLEVSLYCCG